MCLCVHIIVPLIPTGFNYTGEDHGMMDTTLIFDWDPPQGLGPEAIVDDYVISISPSPLSHPGTDVVSSPPWNVTLDHNTLYTINITAMNCAGEGDTFIAAEIEYRKQNRIYSIIQVHVWHC